MPQIGEIKKGREIGKQPKRNFIWQACNVCGKERWVRLLKGQPESLRCCSCNGSIWPNQRGHNNLSWKGGRCKAGYGYIQV